jgi:hypothetical protein
MVREAAGNPAPARIVTSHLEISRGGVPRQGVVRTDLHSRVGCQ